METSSGFELAPSGPLDNIHRRFRAPDGRSQRIWLRAAVVALFAWLPLAVASLVVGVRAGTQVSFFDDIAVHVRFLVVVPLLVLAEAVIGPRSRLVVCEFLKSGLIDRGDLPRFEAGVLRARRLLNSVVVEVFLVVLAVALTWVATRAAAGEGALFWYERAGGAGGGVTPAGRWYAHVATPISVFLFARWWWRYLVWSWFLRRVSKLELRLSASHPDRMGGLGFVGFHQAVFAILALAAGCGASAATANRILYAGADLRDHQAAIIAFAVLSVLAGIAPLFAFSPLLVRLKHRGIFEYGRLGSEYVRSFENKWMRGNSPGDEPLVGSGDIQSLADLGGGFERVSGMKVALVDRRLIFAFTAAVIIPAIPLVLTVMNFKDVLRLLMKIVV